MKKAVTRLADGRELIYFDESDDAVHEALDRRELEERPTASHMRYDPLRDEWVTYAAHRQARTFLPPSSECPLCPSTAEHLTEIPSSHYDVAVFENRFPAFAMPVAGTPAPPPTPLHPVRPGTGRSEVVCFTSDHDGSFAALGQTRARTVIEALVDRTIELSGLPGVEQVFCFENRGEEIGVTLNHPHGQIYAYPFVTPRTRTMMAAARRHAETTSGGNLFGDLLAAERAAGTRVVTENEHWTAYVPAAARWPFEVYVVAHRHVPDLPALHSDERDAFVALYLDLLRRFDGLFGVPMPYISAWHQAPVRVDRDLAWLHLQLFSVRRAPGKLKYLAGSESAMDAFVNDVLPEDAARMLREVAS